MESTIVIKVKYGESLRRFNARVVNDELALDMNLLKVKVLSLFNFSADCDFTLTYVDEDGDVVTIADEEDFHDIMRQSLNPLRVTVRLHTESSNRSYGKSSGNPTPVGSPRFQPPLPILNSIGFAILNSFPEVMHQLDERISRLFTELRSDTVSASPAYAELIDSLAKTILTYLKELPLSSTKIGTSGSSDDAHVTSDINSSKGCKLFSQLESSETVHGNFTGFCDVSSADPNAALCGNKPSIVGSLSANTASGTSDVAGNHMKDKMYKLGRHSEGGNLNDGFVQGNRVSANSRSGDKMKESKKSNKGSKSFGVRSSRSLKHLKYLESDQGSLAGKKAAAGSGYLVGSCFVPNSSEESPSKGAAIDSYSSYVLGSQLAPVVPFGKSYKGSNNMFHMGVGCDGCGVHPITGPRFKSKVKENYDLCIICFADMGNEAEYIRMDYPTHYQHSFSFNGYRESIFHAGVRCDVCGVHPITGPRFKSKVKEDYDLCSICFADMGNEAEYIRMDHPMRYQHPFSLNGFFDPILPQGLRVSAGRSKLDSRFILDLNIDDGTIVPLSAPFTKIWRMANCGTVVWPQGTQLLWIGGDRFSKALSINLKIPADGFPVDKEIDIAVDFSAPDQPGRYISYWRMASPSGHKFGQHVWVLIQVDASLKARLGKNVRGFNLNLPPVSSGIMGSQAENVHVKNDWPPQPDNINRETKAAEPVVNVPPNMEQERNFPINENLLGGATSSSTVTTLGVGPSVKDEVETIFLKELKDMGFKQVDLNKKILKKNEYNLEQSVDDLCGVEEWDPLLKELEEMGFYDKEMNKMLLKKNSGSIKGAVMDLIAREEV